MSELGICAHGDVERLFPAEENIGVPYSEPLQPDDSETQYYLEDVDDGTGATHDLQPDDPPEVLGSRQLRTISIGRNGRTHIQVVTIPPSNKTWDVHTGQKVVCEYNRAWQPVRFRGMKFRRMTGNVLRSGNYIRLQDDWKDVPPRTKEDIWDALMADFYIPPEYNLEAIKRDTFRDMGVKLKSWRHSVKDALKIQPGDTPDTVKARMGQDAVSQYNSDDLDVLLAKWCDPKNQEYVAYMKALRAKNNTPHCTGSMSFAKATHEDTLSLGTTPTRAQNYILTHTKKDGGYLNEVVRERCERMKELIPTDPALTSSVTEGTIQWTPNDAYAQAHGNKPEYTGRVRQLRPNVLPVRGNIHSYYTPSQAWSQNPRSSSFSQMTDRIRELEEERAQQRHAMDEMAKQIEEQKALIAEKDAIFEARFRQLGPCSRRPLDLLPTENSFAGNAD